MTGVRGAVRAFAELLALAGLAVTQPLLDVFGKAPDVFLFREADRSDIIAFAFVVALVPAVGATAVEMVRGTWRTVRFCLTGAGRPGFVELPRDGRSEYAVALWGVLTGEAPDEVPVDIDEERDVLIVHLVDASDPEAVRARHRRTHERSLSKVVR